MKTIITIAALWMGVSAAGPANSFPTLPAGASFEVPDTGVVQMNVHAYEGMKFRLTVTQPSTRLHVRIMNDAGQVLYSEYAGKTEGYTKLFDLSNLTDGTYAFVVETDHGRAEKTFSISTETTRVVTPVSAK